MRAAHCTSLALICLLKVLKEGPTKLQRADKLKVGANKAAKGRQAKRKEDKAAKGRAKQKGGGKGRWRERR